MLKGTKWFASYLIIYKISCLCYPRQKGWYLCGSMFSFVSTDFGSSCPVVKRGCLCIFLANSNTYFYCTYGALNPGIKICYSCFIQLGSGRWQSQGKNEIECWKKVSKKLLTKGKTKSNLELVLERHWSKNNMHKYICLWFFFSQLLSWRQNLMYNDWLL